MESNKRKDEEKDPKRKITAAELDALSTSPTERVRARKAGGELGNTGTNVSYEGPTSTSPAGTGYNSGQSGTGSDISKESEEDARRMASNPREDRNDNEDENDEPTRRTGNANKDEDIKPDTLGTP